MENFDYRQYLTENKLFQEYWSSDDDALAQATEEAEKKLADDFISWAKQNEGSREAPKQGTFFGDETIGDEAVINGQKTWWNLCKSGLWRISQWQIPGLTNSKGDWCSTYSCTFPEILDAIKSLYRNGIQTQNSNMREFNYQEYLSEGWMFKEADLKGFATKDATLSREKRAQKGNWKGSVGKYVENHRAEIDDAAKNGNLRAYVQATMKPALGPEAQEYIETLLSGHASNSQLHQALYNIMLKGNGLGLHEEEKAY